MARFVSAPRSRLRMALLCAAALLTSASVAWADGRTLGGEIWLPVPRDDAKIKADADVRLELPSEDGPWSGLLVLHLQNVGRKPLSLPMALPERPCDPDAEVCNGPKAGHYGELVVEAGGKSLDVAAIEVDEGLAYKPPFGRVLGFVVELAPRAKVDLTVRWTLTPTIDRDGVFANVHGVESWGKRLGKVRLDLMLPYRPWTVGHLAAMKLKVYESAIGSEGAFSGKHLTHLGFEGKRLRAAAIEVHLGTANKLGGAMRCPDPKAIAEAAASGAGAEKTLGKLLVMRNDKELEDCRALLLARQGFPFSDKDVAKRFYGKPVKSASLTETVMEGRERPYLSVGMVRNDRYLNALHPRDEAATIDALAAELRRRRND